MNLFEIADRYLIDPALMDQEPEPPDYLVDGTVERGSVVGLVGDSGTAKSSIARDLAVAVVRGRPWLGRNVERGRVLYIHVEEGPRRAIKQLRALGWRSTDTDLHYWCRIPMRLSEKQGRDWLRAMAERHKADLLVIDSATIAFGIEINDNTAMAETMGWLGLLAMDTDLTVVVVHHEGKHNAGVDRSSGAAKRAALGASQFVAQCDLHLAIELTRNPRGERETTAAGVEDTYRVRLQMPKEREFGDTDGPEDIVKWTLKREDGALLKMELRSVPAGTVSRQRRPSLADRFETEILDAGQPLGRKVCVELNDGKDNGTVSNALKDPRFVRGDDGRYNLA